jgi:hypothetical protein
MEWVGVAGREAPMRKKCARGDGRPGARRASAHTISTQAASPRPTGRISRIHPEEARNQTHRRAALGAHAAQGAPIDRAPCCPSTQKHAQPSRPALYPARQTGTSRSGAYPAAQASTKPLFPPNVPCAAAPRKRRGRPGRTTSAARRARRPRARRATRFSHRRGGPPPRPGPRCRSSAAGRPGPRTRRARAAP